MGVYTLHILVYQSTNGVNYNVVNYIHSVLHSTHIT